MGLTTRKQTHSLVLIFPALKFTFGLYNCVIAHSPNIASMILRVSWYSRNLQEQQKKDMLIDLLFIT